MSIMPPVTAAAKAYTITANITNADKPRKIVIPKNPILNSVLKRI